MKTHRVVLKFTLENAENDEVAEDIVDELVIQFNHKHQGQGYRLVCNYSSVRPAPKQVKV